MAKVHVRCVSHYLLVVISRFLSDFFSILNRVLRAICRSVFLINFRRHYRDKHLIFLVDLITPLLFLEGFQFIYSLWCLSEKNAHASYFTVLVKDEQRPLTHAFKASHDLFLLLPLILLEHLQIWVDWFFLEG